MTRHALRAAQRHDVWRRAYAARHSLRLDTEARLNESPDMGQPRGAVEVTWGRSNVTGLAHAFWIDDDTVDAETSICGRASRLVVERVWFTAEKAGQVPGQCCPACELMLQPKGARLELDHHREAKASRRLERQAEHDAADEQE